MLQMKVLCESLRVIYFTLLESIVSVMGYVSIHMMVIVNVMTSLEVLILHMMVIILMSFIYDIVSAFWNCNFHI